MVFDDPFVPPHTAPQWKLDLMREIIGRGFSQRELERMLHKVEHDYETYVGPIPYRVLRLLITVAAVVVLIVITTLPIPTVVKLVCWVAGGLLFWLLPAQKSWRYRFALVLDDEGVRPLKCACCDYRLEGSVSRECPECGVPLAKTTRSFQYGPGKG